MISAFVSWFKWLVIFAAAVTPAYGVTKPVLNDWFALGSGCRAKFDLPGNVRMEGVPATQSASDTYQAKFVFKDFALTQSVAPESLAKFGRECAVRLNINPPAGKKIVGIKAITSVVASKEPGPQLDLLAELKLGSISLGNAQAKLSDASRVRQREEVIELQADALSKEKFPQLGCGEPKIIGFDYSWIATRSAGKSAAMRVELGKEKSLVIEAKLADCQPD
jgi:hypothetical protein